jgi:cation diffusion facilitator family transporter
LIALVISVVLMLIKFAAYLLTSSNAILTDASESIVNVLASSFAFYSIYLSSLPRDVNHPYGHGKVEFFSAFVEGVLIVVAGVLIIAKSAYNLVYPAPIGELAGGIVLIAFTGVVNYFTGMFLIRESEKHGSLALQADGKHLQTDAYSSFGLVAGLGLIYFTGLTVLDSVLSIALGLYICFSGYKLIRRSVGGLMDESDFNRIEKLVQLLDRCRHDAWIDVHNLRTQQYGSQLHVDCHVTLPYYYSLEQVHDEISSIDKIMNEQSTVNNEFFIHADPCLPQCCHYCRMKDCPVRAEEKRVDIRWTMENVTRNQKHFE